MSQRLLYRLSMIEPRLQPEKNIHGAPLLRELFRAYKELLTAGEIDAAQNEEIKRAFLNERAALSAFQVVSPDSCKAIAEICEEITGKNL
ncbi:MAG: hypothetical protein WAW37_14225 [Syntrophobacteraceae bacterium]